MAAPGQETIEDIVLDHDRRGISALRGLLPSDFCTRAASLVLEHPGKALIATGFYIVYGGAPETDGPVGAAVIGSALEKLGYEVVYVTDRYCHAVMQATAPAGSRVLDFPIAGPDESQRLAADLLARERPSVAISIERCGQTAEGKYRNMRGQDITDYNARLDYIFTQHPDTVAIGDGGNEIGLGNLAEAVAAVPTLVRLPCVTRVSRLIITSVSNWGGYGLVAALSELSGRNLLPSVEEEQEVLRRCVAAGAVDGIGGKAEMKVDGFTMEENSQAVRRLHDYLARRLPRR